MSPSSVGGGDHALRTSSRAGPGSVIPPESANTSFSTRKWERSQQDTNGCKLEGRQTNRNWANSWECWLPGWQRAKARGNWFGTQSCYQAQEEAGLQAAPNPGQWVKSPMDQLVPFSFHTFQVTAPLPPQQKAGGLVSKEDQTNIMRNSRKSWGCENHRESDGFTYEYRFPSFFLFPVGHWKSTE